jgi:uncharacterized protein YdcH (DUF465 family)
MLSQYEDIIPAIKESNSHFATIFEKHEELNKKIDEIEAGRGHAEQEELEVMKKEKLKLKDEAYAIIVEYKKNNA